MPLALAPHPSSVSEARRLVRDALDHAGREDLLDDAELLVSEVVTNAVVHAGTPFDVVVIAGEAGVRVEVSDGSPHLPTPRLYADLAGTGRGLRMLELLVTRWGVDPRHDGKTVWFELGRTHGAEASAMEVGDLPRGAGPRTLDVVLLHVPLLLHAAWQMHAESLLREHLLARLDVGDAMVEIETHAAANDAMSLLHEQIPAPDLDPDPSALLAAATEPLVTAERLVLEVPAESVANFHLLGATLDDAIELALTGAFLTPPIQPEMREMRRWLCGQVATQCSGAAPVPWAGVAHDAPPEGGPLDWDPTVVEGATDAKIAADDTSRIIAVSPAALELLGHDTVASVVGERLVEIIPDRFRQAHLAGFTLHLVVGRSPLIGRTVGVPVLRRDGTEVPVELTLRATPLPGGRVVFVADLRPA